MAAAASPIRNPATKRQNIGVTTSQEEAKNRPRRAARKACAVAAIFAALCSSLLGLGISSAGAGGSTASFTILYTNNDGGPCRPPNPDFCNPVYSVIDEQIVLVAFVGTNAAGPAKPTGTVTFRDAGTVLSAVLLNSSNVAVYFAVFAPGPHVFTASYAGDGTFGPSSGDGAVPAQVTQTVQDNCAIVTGEVASPGPTVFQDGRWYQKSGYGGGRVGNCFNWGAPGQIPVLGDWDGDGKQTIGVYAAGRWYLRNSSKSGPIEIIFDWGSPGMIPVVGGTGGVNGVLGNRIHAV